MIAFVDTETTGLPQPIGASIDKQPYLTEICIILLDKHYNFVDSLDTLVKPPIPIPPFITKITNINDAMVKKSPRFAEIYKPLKKILKQADTLVVQNFEFDRAMLEYEAKRIGKKIKFPKNRFCTVEQSLHKKGRRLKLVELYQMATGEPTIPGAHRAKNDVMAMVEVYKFIMRDIK